MAQVCLLAWLSSHPQSQILLPPSAGQLPLYALFELVSGPLQPFVYGLTVGPDLIGSINDCSGAKYFSVKTQPSTLSHSPLNIMTSVT